MQQTRQEENGETERCRREHGNAPESAQSENSCAAMRRCPCARPATARRRRPPRVLHAVALGAAADADVTTAICVVGAGAASDALDGVASGAGVADVVASGAEEVVASGAGAEDDAAGAADVVAGAGSAAPEDAPSQTAGPGIFRPYGLEYTLKFA